MKIKGEFVVRQIMNEYIIVPVGHSCTKIHGMISGNDTGVFIWQCLQEEQTVEELMCKLLDTYEVDEATARTGLGATVKVLLENDLLDALPEELEKLNIKA